MDSVFHPDFKRWIHRQYIFSATGTDHPQSQNAESSDQEISAVLGALEHGEIGPVISLMPARDGRRNSQYSKNVGSIKSELLALSGIMKFEPRETTDVTDHEMISNLGADIAENLYEDRADELLDAFEDDDDNLSLASDVSDVLESHTADSVNEMIQVGSVAEIQTNANDTVDVVSSSVRLPPEIQIGVPAVRFVIERNRSQMEQPEGSDVTEAGMKRSERLRKRIKTEQHVPIKKERHDKLTDVINQTNDASPISQSLPSTSASSFADPMMEASSWEDNVRAEMKMSQQEYSNFVQSQGLLDKSKEVGDWMDFGTQDPKGCPKSALPIVPAICEKSNTLRIYQNICKPNSVSGAMVTNAFDLAFYQPGRDTDSKSSTNILRVEDLIVTVDLYFPSVSNVQFRDHAVQKMKVPAVSTTVSIVATQTVKDLYDKLHCENDLVPTKEITTLKELDQLEKAEYATGKDESAGIFIDDTLYVVKQPNSFANAVKQWKGQKLLENSQPIQIRIMSEYQLKDTNFRPGYPYLYRHHGCEHLLVFTNVRQVHETDPKSLESYPRVTYIQTLPPLKCRVDSNHIAKVIVKDDPRLPESTTPLCKECCSEFCFIRQGKREVKTSNMKIYPLVQMGNLPMSNLII